ncbi:hypothetical protein GCM10023339_40880 [Alloalcanivorax gelatiniphagus]
MVDYRCTVCNGVFEQLVEAPPRSTAACAACHGESRRLFGTAGLIGAARRTNASSATRPGRPGSRSSPSSPSGQGAIDCRDNPDVPGLCHLSREAAEVWVARARNDDKALKAAYTRQEKILESGGTLSATGAHAHQYPTVKVTPSVGARN